jgi:hypothetical protein
MPTSVLGGQSEATIDQANIAMRAMPWYQDQLRSWGMDPGHPGKLNDRQKTALTRAAQANGFVVDEGHIEMDDHGNFNPIGHKLRNTLIVVGMAAATIATMGAAGVFAGAAGTGLGAAEGVGAYGVGDAALAGLGTGAMGAVPVAGGVAAAGALPAGVTLEGIAAGGGGASTAVPAGTAAAASGGGLSSAELGAMAGELPEAGGGVAAAGGGAATSGFDAAGNWVGSSTYNIPAGGGLGAGWVNSPMGLGLIGTGINAATSIYGMNKQADAAQQAALLNSQSAASQLAFLKEKDAADRAAQLVRDAEAKREWDTTTGLNLAQWNRRQAQLEPYRQKSLAAGQELSRRLGLPAPTGGWNVPNPPVTLADASLYGGGGGAAGGAASVAPTPTDPSLSDPSKWMALVGNDAQLTDFVTKGLGNAAAVPGLVDYYKGKVKGQPGANPTEQAGSAAYWNEKFANDPNRTGGSTTLAAVVPTTTRAPFQPSASSLAAFTPVVIPGAQSTMTLADLYGPMGAV